MAHKVPHSYAPPGRMFYVGQITGGPTTGTSADFADGEMVVMPVVLSFGKDIDTFRFEITGAGTGDFYVVVYDALEDGYPNVLQYQSPAIDIGSTGIKTDSPGAILTFDVDRLYWVGILADTTVTPTIRRRNAFEGALDVSGLLDTQLANFSLGIGAPEGSLKLIGQTAVAPDPFPSSIVSNDQNDTPVMTIELA